jgi:hypothetical protein
MTNISVHNLTNRSLSDALTITSGTPNTMAIDAKNRFSSVGTYTLTNSNMSTFKLALSNFINDGQYRIRIKVNVEIGALNIILPANFYGVPDLGFNGIVDKQFTLYPSNGSRVTIYINNIDGEYEISARIAS